MPTDLSMTTITNGTTDDPMAPPNSTRIWVDELLGAARTGTARTERSRRTRAGLVAGVRDELRETGAFTADTVAERAGCSPATFYGHFATKDDALALAFELVLVDLANLTDETLTIEQLEVDGLEATVRSWIVRQTSFFGAESLVFRAALARLPFHRGIRHAYREAERVALDQLVAVITAGQAVGLIRDDPPTALAEAFLVLSQGLNNPHVLRSPSGSVHEHLHRSLVATLAPSEVSA